MSDKNILFGALRSVMLLSAGTLIALTAADSIARPEKASGGFLYSDYLERGVPAAADESFAVSAGVPFWNDALARAKSDINGLSFGEYLIEQHINNAGSATDRAYSDITAAGWRLGADLIEDGALAATEARVRRLDVDIETSAGSGFTNVGVDAIGSFHETDHNALAWQLRGYTGFNTRYGLNFGWLYRHIVEQGVVGGNFFLDYESFENTGFWRWSLGGEVRTAWLDVHGNYYHVPSSAEVVNDVVTYSSNGYDIRAHVHSPNKPLLAGIFGYYRWEGEHGLADDEGILTGVRITPQQAPLLFELTWRTGDDSGHGGRFSYTHEFGASGHQTASHVQGGEFRPQDYFFVSAEREYTHRIRKGRVPDVLVPGNLRVFGLSGSASLRSVGPRFDATVSTRTEVR